MIRSFKWEKRVLGGGCKRTKEECGMTSQNINWVIPDMGIFLKGP